MGKKTDSNFIARSLGAQWNTDVLSLSPLAWPALVEHVWHSGTSIVHVTGRETEMGVSAPGFFSGTTLGARCALWCGD